VTVSDLDRRRWRIHWRSLAQKMVQAANNPSSDPADLRPVTHDTANWITPTGKKADDWLCKGFADVARAWARQDTVARRREMAPAVLLLASMVGDLLDATDAPAPEPSNVRPFRRDIDG